MRRRPWLIALFSLGTVLGFGSAAVHAWAHWRYGGHPPWRGAARWEERERRWAERCVEAAARAPRPRE